MCIAAFKPFRTSAALLDFDQLQDLVKVKLVPKRGTLEREDGVVFDDGELKRAELRDVRNRALAQIGRAHV